MQRRLCCAVVGSWLLHLTLGTFYCWGVVATYVTSYMRWRGIEVDYQSASVVFSLAGLSLGLSMYAGGRLQAAVGVRGAALAGGWLMSLGVGLSSVTVQHGLAPFALTYGVMFGAGIGLAYTAPIACLIRWMPGRRGLAAGLVVLAFGAGATLFAPLMQAWANPGDLPPTQRLAGGAYYDPHDPDAVAGVLQGVPQLLRRLALVYATMQLLGASLLLEPPQPTGLEEALHGGRDSEALEAPARQYAPREMASTRQFWLLVANFGCSIQPCFFATVYAKEIMSEDLRGGVSDESSTATLAVAALFNGVGRVVWGYLCDRTSFQTSMVLLCLLQALLLVLLPSCRSIGAYGACLCGIFFCVGGIFALLPAATAAYFGTKHVGPNYGLVFLGQSFGMLLAPHVAAAALGSATAGGLSSLCYVEAAFVLAGAALSALNGPPLRTD